MIKISSLNKSYGLKKVLKNIELEFNSGKAYGIVGENGAGKTTLFRCIAGLEKYEGQIQSNAIHLKDELGLLFTEPYFMAKMTGREYIQLFCNARKKSVSNLDERNIFELPLDEFATSYSTGMKKKLALTALLFQENNYFILDEPFNGVDIQSNILITDIILKLKSLNKTILISSHIFSTLRDTCDEIFVLAEGEIQNHVTKDQFDALEDEMKLATRGNKIELLDLK
jgi:ABC-2 type transport system ATP-binding protein